MSPATTLRLPDDAVAAMRREADLTEQPPVRVIIVKRHSTRRIPPATDHYRAWAGGRRLPAP